MAKGTKLSLVRLRESNLDQEMTATRLHRQNFSSPGSTLWRDGQGTRVQEHQDLVAVSYDETYGFLPDIQLG